MDMRLWGQKFYVYGPNNHDSKYHLWMFETLEDAKNFAENICRDTGHEYMVLEKKARCAIERPVVWKDE